MHKLGYPKKDVQLTKLLAILGQRYDKTCYETVNCLVYKNEGIELTFNKDEYLISIHLFSEGLDGKMGYARGLPFGVTFEDVSKQVIAKMPEPPVASGGGNLWRERIVPSWDRFKVADVYVYFQYSRFNSKVELVNLTLADEIDAIVA